MLNWSEWESEQQPKRATVLPYWVAVLLGLGIAGALWAGKVYAEPRFVVQDKDITITLFDDACELKDQITNLPYKAVWVEKDKTYQGCWGPRPDLEAVIFYFDDKTAGAISFGAIKKAVGV